MCGAGACDVTREVAFVVRADWGRHTCQQGVDAILDAAVTQDVAFLVVGDPFAATTHTDLQLRARHAHEASDPASIDPL